MKLEKKFDIYWLWQKLLCKKLAFDDWWWRNIGAPRANRKDDRLQAKWRAKYGYNKWATWAPGEDILEHSMLVLREWLKTEWGEPPTYHCETHTKEMHDDIERYVFRAERYCKMACNDGEFPITAQELELRLAEARATREERYELESELYQGLGELIKKYGITMWT